MKKTLCSLLVFGLLFAVGCRKRAPEQSEGNRLEGTITISGAWALYPMAVKWAEEFQKIHPGVRIDVAAGGAGKGMADCLARVVDIGMVSREIYQAEIDKGAWSVAVTRDAVVPAVNENNPVLSRLLSQGVKRQTFIGIWITGKIKNWGEVTGDDKDKNLIHVYSRSDACGAAETWAKFLGHKQEDMLGVGVYGDPGLAEAVAKDESGIGFNNINYAYDARTKSQVKGIRVLPIDFDGNGLIDEDEDFYSNRDQIVQAIASGSYPSPPARDLHFVSAGKPRGKIVMEFIKWVLMDGQKYVGESGYVNLSKEKIQEELGKIKSD
jgi:phosphate transport system substrate-binding protein